METVYWCEVYQELSSAEGCKGEEHSECGPVSMPVAVVQELQKRWN